MRTMIALLLLNNLLTHPSIGQTEVTFLYEPHANNLFGNAIAIDGDLAIVGISGADFVNPNSGGAALFQWDGQGWAYLGVLNSSDLAESDQFGYAVDMAGDFVVVSANLQDEVANDAGAVYVFNATPSITEIAKLVDGTGLASDWFGNDVAVSVDANGFPVVLVGASAKEPNGAAFVFRSDGTEFALEETFSVETPATNFGFSVDIDGDIAIVGAPALDSAYVYQWDGQSWLADTVFAGLNGSEFGHSVAISADLIAVGAPLDNDAGSSAGAVHLFRQQDDNTWLQEAKLTASNPSPSDEFGFSVDLWTGIGKDLLFVGAPKGGDEVALNAGAAYRFVLEDAGWEEAEEDNPSSAVWDDRMGTAVAGTFIPGMNDIILLAGAPAYDDVNLNLADVGAVYSYISPAITCQDISRMKTRCRSNGRAAGVVLLDETAYEGVTVQFLVDGIDTIPAVVQANRVASFSASGYSAGCSVALIDPPGCSAALTPNWEPEEDIALNQDPSESSGLQRNYPNPFNPSTWIGYTVASDVHVRLIVYNILGQTVATLVDEFQGAGERSVMWKGTNDNGESVSSGLYLYKLTAGNLVQTETMMLAK